MAKEQSVLEKISSIFDSPDPKELPTGSIDLRKHPGYGTKPGFPPAREEAFFPPSSSTPHVPKDRQDPHYLDEYTEEAFQGRRQEHLNLVELDNQYQQLLQRQQQELHTINAQRAGRLQSLSDEEVYRQLYEQNQLDVSRGKTDGIDQGVLRPQSSPYYPPSNQTPAQRPPAGQLPVSQIPRSLVNPELYGKGQMTDSDAQEKHDDVTGMLGGAPGGSPMLKAAQIMAQASQGAPGTKFKRSPVTIDNLPATEAEWKTYEDNLDYSKGGHVGDMFGGKFPSHSKGYYGAPRMRDGKLTEDAHMGQDYSTPRGTDLPAPSNGVLVPYGLGGATDQSGHSIRFYGDDGHAHKFMHMDKAMDIKAVAKSLGRDLNADGSLNINRGDVIGQTGNSGWPSRGGQNYAIHLHHEVMKLKEGQEHNYTATGLDKGQTRYDHIDPKQWMKSNAISRQKAPEVMKEKPVVEAPIETKAVPFNEATKGSITPDIAKFIEEMKKRNKIARGG